MANSVKVKALVSVMGMVRGQEYVLNANSTVDALIDAGFLVWIDQPSPSEVAFDLTPEVQKRAAADKKPAVAKAVRQNPGGDTPAEIVAPKVKPSPKRSDESEAPAFEAEVYSHEDPFENDLGQVERMDDDGGREPSA